MIIDDEWMKMNFRGDEITDTTTTTRCCHTMVVTLCGCLVCELMMMMMMMRMMMMRMRIPH